MLGTHIRVECQADPAEVPHRLHGSGAEAERALRPPAGDLQSKLGASETPERIQKVEPSILDRNIPMV